MISTLSSSDPLLANPFSAYAGSFSMWDSPDPFSSFKPTNPKPVTSSSGSDEQNQSRDEPNRSHDDKQARQDRYASVVDERKRRRMISNRESARRSRMRKQRHVENLRNQLNKRRVENRELNNRLQFILHHLNRVQTENEWLRSERTVLFQNLSNFTQILVFQQLHPLDHISTTCMAMQ